MGCVRRLKYFVKNIYGEINAFIIRKYVFAVSPPRGALKPEQKVYEE